MTPLEHGQPVEFHINELATVPATIVAADQARLTIEVDPAAWERIDLLLLFHLEWTAREQGNLSGAQPVQIELRLDSEVATALVGLPDGPDEFATAIAGAPVDSPLRNQASWYALSVTEAVDLPPELAELGEVRSGFTTVWADQAL